MRRTLVALLAGISLAACGHPLIPPSALKTPAPPSGKIAGGAAPAGPASAPVLGVDLYASDGYPVREVRSDGARSLAYIKQVLGAQSVGIVWNLYSPSTRSDVVRRSPISLSPSAVAALVTMARADGLSVQLRPLIRVGRRRTWEGRIRPRDPSAWQASLYRAERPYLQVAQRLGVSQFVVGTELVKVGLSGDWPSFLTMVRSVYSGQLSYAAQMKQYFGRPRAMPPVGVYGLDAYPDEDDLPATASAGQVAAAWYQVFAQTPASVLHRTVISEISIPALAGAYVRPWNWNMARKRDDLVQARWFTAACEAVWRYRLRGIYFYEVNLTDDPARPSQFAAFFMGRPASVTAIRGCRSLFARPAARSPAPGR